MTMEALKKQVKLLFVGTILLILIFSVLSGISSTNSNLNQESTTNKTQGLQNPYYEINAPIMIFSQVHEINDDTIGNSDGDGDNLPDAGETIELRLRIENTGDLGVTNVYGHIASTNPLVTISSENQSYIAIDAGESGVSTSYYLIEFDSKLNASDTIDFDLTITANEGTWFDIFSIVIVGVPHPKVYGHEIWSESNGDLNADDDGIMDPGEIITMKLFVENIGDSIMYSIDGYIATSDPYIIVTDGTGIFGDIDRTIGVEFGYFSLDISGACPEQHNVSFELALSDSFNNWWNLTFEMVVSGTSEYNLTAINFLEYAGDGDEYMDAGESWYVSMTVKNIGPAVGRNVNVYLGSSSPHIEFYYLNDHNVTITEILSGFSSSQSDSYDWRFTVKDTAAENEILELFVSIIDDSSQAATIINVSKTVTGVADYELYWFKAQELCYDSDNCNGIVDAGDNLIVNISILNIGAATGRGITVYLYAHSSLVEFYDENGSSYEFGDVLEEGWYFWHYGYWEWDITISEKARKGQVLDFTVVVIDASLREWYFEANITVQTGPNTFLHTWQGIVTVVGVVLFTAAMIIWPALSNREKKKEKRKETKKEKKKGFSDKLSDWQEKRKKQRKIREKKRLQKQQEREAIRQDRERERIARINANEKELLEKFESILEMTESVKTSQVAKSLALNKSQLFEKLIQWQDVLPFKIDGDYIEVEDTKDFNLSVREKIAEISKHYSCFECGFPIERTIDICPDCKQKVLKCSVCKLPISFGDDIGICPHCEIKGHLTHFQEWLKTQGKCPVCLKELSTDELLQNKGWKKK